MSLTGTKTAERVGEDLISDMVGQVRCRGGRRETSNLEKTGSVGKGVGEDGDSEETKAEAEGEQTSEGAGDGLERVSATTFSGQGMWTTELVNSAM